MQERVTLTFTDCSDSDIEVKVTQIERRAAAVDNVRLEVLPPFMLHCVILLTIKSYNKAEDSRAQVQRIAWQIQAAQAAARETVLMAQEELRSVRADLASARCAIAQTESEIAAVTQCCQDAQRTIKQQQSIHAKSQPNSVSLA